VLRLSAFVYGPGGQDVIDDPQECVRQGDHSLFGPARRRSTRRKRACRALSFVLRPAGAGGRFDRRAVRSQRLPFRVFPDLCLPALSLFPGQRAAQLAQLQFPFKERVGLGAMTGKFVESGPGPGKPRSRTASSEADCKTRTDER
jgi:hypothetical protein